VGRLIQFSEAVRSDLTIVIPARGGIDSTDPASEFLVDLA
jgi:hypothetical protein